MYSKSRAEYESALSRAHRALYVACEAADDCRDEGAADDCRQLLKEVTRLAEASLKGKLKVKPHPDQLEIPT